VSTEVGFLNSFAQALSVLSLYPEGHSSRQRALDAAFQQLRDLVGEFAKAEYSFIGDEVIFGKIPVRELRGWEWGKRLASIGIQRVEFDVTATRDELEEFIDQTLALLTQKQQIDTSEARQMRPSGIRWGEVGIRDVELRDSQVKTATLTLTLGEEAEAIRWLHREVTAGNDLPMIEAEAVVRGLSVAMHGDQRVILPLLSIKRYDQYTTTHSLNVCVLTMALAEWLGMASRDVRAFGVAGLLHDLGKVKVPLDILNKPGKLDKSEREVMNKHPEYGANLIITKEPNLDLAAVVAYEHHIMLNGQGGYPAMAYKRQCHQASNLVHVCDVFDALRTNRPYRDAWPTEKVLAYLEERAGVEFDGLIAHQFAEMIRRRESQILSLGEDDELPVS